jgi:hypothetical protein
VHLRLVPADATRGGPALTPVSMSVPTGPLSTDDNQEARPPRPSDRPRKELCNRAYPAYPERGARARARAGTRCCMHRRAQDPCPFIDISFDAGRSELQIFEVSQQKVESEKVSLARPCLATRPQVRIGQLHTTIAHQHRPQS